MIRASKLFLVLLVALIGCDVSPDYAAIKASRYRSTGFGYIRSIDWYHKIVVHETDGGFTKSIYVCDPPIQLWVGEHADIRFYWVDDKLPQEPGLGCDRIFEVRRDGKDIK